MTNLAMKRVEKTRLDQLLVERGLAESREKARALILAGQVLVGGQKSDKPGHSVAADSRVELLERMPYVSRGGFKLAAALDHFGINVAGKFCLDVGASTGGFTDVLLQRGAKLVYALDVGHAQLDWKIRNDPRVFVREGVNARHLDPADFPQRFDLAVCDVSFISATLIVPAMAPLLAPEGAMIVLVKPQFEVGREDVGKGGIVRDPQSHQKAIERVTAAAIELSLEVLGVRPSHLTGAEGNQEFFLHARARG